MTIVVKLDSIRKEQTIVVEIEIRRRNLDYSGRNSEERNIMTIVVEIEKKERS